MAIYSTDTYEIISIMNIFITKTNNVTTFKTATLYVQALPVQLYPYILPACIDSEYGLVQEDYDVYDRFVANVIPIFETACYPIITNKVPEGTKSSANSAISPISMLVTSYSS